MDAGVFSAEKTGTVTSLRPIPTPKSTRQTASWPQVWEQAMPIGARREKIAAMKIVWRRPRMLLMGSEIHAVLQIVSFCVTNQKGMSNLQEANGNIRARIDEPNDPAVPLTRARGRALRTSIGNAQSPTESQVRAVAASLIPALDGRGDRVHDDGEVQDPRLLEAVGALLAQCNTLGLIQLLELLKEKRSLGDESTFAE